MNSLLVIILGLGSGQAGSQVGEALVSGDEPGAVAVVPAAAVDPESAEFFIERGPGRVPIGVPRNERLVYDVYVDLPVLGDTRAGNVVLSAGVEPYRPPLAMPGETAQGDEREVGWLKSVATGRALNYTLNHEISVRHLPQDWPRVLLRDTQRGSENRRREMRLGLRDGKWAAEYRKDRHCKGCERREHFVEGSFPWSDDRHCKKCKRGEHRVWRASAERDLPEGAVDMLSAIYLARDFLRHGEQRAQFPLVDRDDVWEVTLLRGSQKVAKTKAGRFLCRKVKLKTAAPEGEDCEDEKFQGLFGIQGDIRIYLHAATGVPVIIEGDIPLGFIDLKARVKLRSFSGTPAGFAALPKRGR